MSDSDDYKEEDGGDHYDNNNNNVEILMRKSIICTCKCEVCHYSLLLV
jgi:hypothetical protein